MIHSLTCKNFYSFNGKVSVSFTVDENAPKNDSYIRAKSGKRLSLVETVIGPNASGKTNLLKVLPVLRWVIVDSWDANPAADMPIKTFLPNASEDTPAELSAVFEVGSTIYEYEIHLTAKKIVYERLGQTNKTTQRTTQKLLFKRSLKKKGEGYDYDLKGFAAPAGLGNLLNRQNASTLSIALRLEHKLSKKIAGFWQKIEHNMTESGWVGNHVLGGHANLQNAISFYHLNPRLKEKAEEVLARFDLGFDAFVIEQLNNQLIPHVAHNFGAQTLDLPMEYESSGTRHLFVILKSILLVLEGGGMAIIDEFDASLHPDMVSELVGLFTDAATNQNHAQLFMSTHSHRILAQLDKYQIVLTEKNESGVTDAWRLDEMQGVRADQNYYTKYMAGAYGAVPNLS
jgi:AAA15 family ATPase/GTPase